MNSILQDVENGFKFIGKLFSDLVNAIWNTARQQLMADGAKIISDESVIIQNATPGLPSRQLGEQLLAAAAGDLAADLASLTWGEILTIVGVVTTDYEQAIGGTSGNAGNLPGGVETT